MREDILKEPKPENEITDLGRTLTYFALCLLHLLLTGFSLLPRMNFLVVAALPPPAFCLTSFFLHPTDLFSMKRLFVSLVYATMLFSPVIFKRPRTKKRLAELLVRIFAIHFGLIFVFWTLLLLFFGWHPFS